MRIAALSLIATLTLAACDNPVKQQAARDTRHDPVRADTVLALEFQPRGGGLDSGQVNQISTMVASTRHAQRDEFQVVTDGSGGALQQWRARQVSQSLSNAGARWVTTSVDPSMAMGPDQVVVVRSEYRIAERDCPNYNPASIANPNEAAMPGFACADAYNMGQMLARPRDAAGGRTMSPADGTVASTAIQRYREGRVKVATGTGGSSGGTGTTSTTTGGTGAGGASESGGIMGGGSGGGPTVPTVPTY
jgi:pilus biogenesis lipoprotein CpaD